MSPCFSCRGTGFIQVPAIEEPNNKQNPIDLASKISEFKKDQEPLGKEFEKVLHDNLWDLY
jgi:hypothetical protein